MNGPNYLQVQLQPTLQGRLKSNFNTDGRTDGLTKNQLTTATILTVCNARAHTANTTQRGQK